MVRWFGRTIGASRLTRAGVVALIAVGCFWLFEGAANAQGIPGLTKQEDAGAEVDPATPEAVATRAAAVAAEIEALEAAAKTAAPARREHLGEVRDRLRSLADLLANETSLIAPSNSGADAPPATDVPPSVFALDALYEARFALEAAADDKEARVEAARVAVDRAKERLAAATRKRRAARTAAEEATPGAKAAAERTLELRELDVRLAHEFTHLRALELRAALASRRERGDDEALDARIEAMRAALAEGGDDASAGFAALAARETQLYRQREAAERGLERAEVLAQAVQSRFAQQAHASPDLLEEIESFSVRRDALRHEVELADAKLARIARQRDLLRKWDTLLRGEPKRDELEAWATLAGERIETLAATEMQRDARVADLDSRLERHEARRATLAEGSALRDPLDEQMQALRRLRDLQSADVLALAAERRTAERFLADIHHRIGYIDPWEYAGYLIEEAQGAWSYEITTFDDEPITIGSLLQALFLFLLGLWAARRGSATVARVSEDRLKLDAGASHALQTLSFYALLVGFTLLALRAVHFPLTAFTVLGGAVAIGVGFGSQNVMNNFISGLILMLERPVRARDVVEVDGNHGTIENIGARSTQIRSTDGRHIIVPNSFFLESNVVNWTLSDDLIRAKVSVGVIYGSPTRLVEELIARVVNEDPQVIRTPEPIIIFEEFADNSLNFDVYFWVRARSPMEVRKVQSGVRFRIDDLFREHDLVIAFPQRDVHLDSASPIEVRMVRGPGEPESQG